MMMGGLERTMLILILRLQQVLVPQQVAVMMMAINIDTEIAQRLVQVLVQPLMAMMVTIKIAQRLVQVQQLLQEEEVVAQQVLVLQPLVVEQQQVKVFNFFFSILNSVKSDTSSSMEYRI
jgi:hypothetical protein